jgi:hypothetical protein
MAHWDYFIFAALIFISLDFAFGFGLIFAGFGLFALVLGLTRAVGINILDYDLLIELIGTAIFAPIAVRLAFLMRRRPPDIAQPNGSFEARNAPRVLNGMVVGLPILQLFTYHFITAGLVVVAVAAVAGMINAQLSFGSLLALGSIGGAYLANVHAEARQKREIWKLLWIAGGVLFGPLYAVTIFLMILAIQPP